MMKRWIALCLALAMAWGCAASAWAEAEERKILSDKLISQLNDRSGLKGRLTFTAKGEPLSPLESALNGLTLELSYIVPWQPQTGNGAAFQMLMDLKRGETTLCSLQADGAEGSCAVNLDLLPQAIWKVPVDFQPAAQFLLGEELGKESYLSMALALSRFADENNALENALAPYLSKLETWVQSLGSEPVVEKSEAGETLMRITAGYPLKPSRMK